MYHKINEIVQDIENELDCFEAIERNDLFDRDIDKFTKRLRYNIEEIEKICNAEKAEQEKIDQGQHLQYHTFEVESCPLCNPKKEN